MPFLSFFILFLSGATNLLLAFLVFRRKENPKSNIFYAMLTLSLSLWSFSVLFLRFFSNYENVVLSGKIANFALVSAVFLFFLFAVYFPKNIRKTNSPFIFLLFFIYLFFALSSLFGNLIVSGAEIIKHANFLIYGELFLPFIVFLLILFLTGYLILIFELKSCAGLFRRQLTYIIVGASATFFIGFVINFILMKFSDHNYNWIGPSSSLIAAGCAFYAITHYRLMGIKFLASKIWSGLFIVIFSFVVFYIVHYAADVYLVEAYQPLVASLGIVFVFAYTAILFPLLGYAQKTSDEIFYKGMVFRKILKDLFLELNKAIELKEIFQILAVNLKLILSVKDIHVLIFSSGLRSKRFDISKEDSFNYLFFPEPSQIISTVRKQSEIIIRYEIDNKKLKEEMDRMNFKIIIPLRAGFSSSDEAIGFIALGRKYNSEAYTSEDISFLETISMQGGSVINNALVYQKLLDLNKNLKNKVREQTKSSREKALYLKKILDERADFLNIASHQLRTPATVIKGMLSMISDDSVKTADQKREFLEICFKKSNKLTEIINDILRASEMDTEEFKIDLQPTDLKSVLENIFQEKKYLAEEKKLEFTLELPPGKMPMIMSSQRHLEQAFSSLIDNAIQYTDKGFVKIEVKLFAGRKKFFEIRIMDSGIGIPQEFKDKVFEKFIRADNAVSLSVDGSGLGLFIIKKIISAHPGAEVYIEKTEIGKGTVFVLKFPILGRKSVKLAKED